MNITSSMKQHPVVAPPSSSASAVGDLNHDDDIDSFVTPLEEYQNDDDLTSTDGMNLTCTESSMTVQHVPPPPPPPPPLLVGNDSSSASGGGVADDNGSLIAVIPDQYYQDDKNRNNHNMMKMTTMTIPDNTVVTSSTTTEESLVRLQSASQHQDEGEISDPVLSSSSEGLGSPSQPEPENHLILLPDNVPSSSSRFVLESSSTPTGTIIHSSNEKDKNQHDFDEQQQEEEEEEVQLGSVSTSLRNFVREYVGNSIIILPPIPSSFSSLYQFPVLLVSTVAIFFGCCWSYPACCGYWPLLLVVTSNCLQLWDPRSSSSSLEENEQHATNVEQEQQQEEERERKRRRSSTRANRGRHGIRLVETSWQVHPSGEHHSQRTYLLAEAGHENEQQQKPAATKIKKTIMKAATTTASTSDGDDDDGDDDDDDDDKAFATAFAQLAAVGVDDHAGEGTVTYTGKANSDNNTLLLSEQQWKDKIIFDEHKENVLNDIPEEIKSKFGQIMFSKWSDKYLPVLVLSPFSIPPGKLRDMWYAMYNKVKRQNRMKYMHNMIYWYGEGKNPYSFVAKNALIPYGVGVEKGYDQLPDSNQNTPKRKTKKRGIGNELLIRGLEKMKLDILKKPEERGCIAGLDFLEVYMLPRESSLNDGTAVPYQPKGGKKRGWITRRSDLGESNAQLSSSTKQKMKQLGLKRRHTLSDTPPTLNGKKMKEDETDGHTNIDIGSRIKVGGVSINQKMQERHEYSVEKESALREDYEILPFRHRLFENFTDGDIEHCETDVAEAPCSRESESEELIPFSIFLLRQTGSNVAKCSKSVTPSEEAEAKPESAPSSSVVVARNESTSIKALYTEAEKQDERRKQARENSARRRSRIAEIEKKSVEERTEVETSLYRTFQMRRESGRKRRKEMALKKKEAKALEIKRILSKPEAERSESEVQFLVHTRAIKKRKVDAGCNLAPLSPGTGLSTVETNTTIVPLFATQGSADIEATAAGSNEASAFLSESTKKPNAVEPAAEVQNQSDFVAGESRSLPLNTAQKARDFVHHGSEEANPQSDRVAATSDSHETATKMQDIKCAWHPKDEYREAAGLGYSLSDSQPPDQIGRPSYNPDNRAQGIGEANLMRISQAPEPENQSIHSACCDIKDTAWGTFKGDYSHSNRVGQPSYNGYYGIQYVTPSYPYYHFGGQMTESTMYGQYGYAQPPQHAAGGSHPQNAFFSARVS